MHIVVVNAKGGCGKSLIATQLASYYACEGKDVVIRDHDRQHSSLDWLQARPKKFPPIRGVSGAARGIELECYDVIINDLPAGYDIRRLSQDVPRVDKLLIPTIPSPTDLRVLWRFSMMLTYSGLLESNIDMGFVVNRYRANAQFNRTMDKFLKRMSIPVLGRIRDTQNYIHVTNRGLGIYDLPATKTEIDRRSWRTIIDWLGEADSSEFVQVLMDELEVRQLQLV